MKRPGESSVLPRYYVDSSAYVAVLVGEEGHTEVSARITGGTLLSSVLLLLETSRTLTWLTRNGALTEEEYDLCSQRLVEDRRHFMLRDLTEDLCAGTCFPAVTTPRSLDLAHLRTALWFHEREPLGAFVTLDGRQERAARELGLPV